MRPSVVAVGVRERNRGPQTRAHRRAQRHCAAHFPRSYEAYCLSGKLAAKGGVFLYGGVVQKLSALMDKQAFRAAFEAKAPLEKFLAQIPTRLITHPTPGLIGCAAVAAHW